MWAGERIYIVHILKDSLHIWLQASAKEGNCLQYHLDIRIIITTNSMKCLKMKQALVSGTHVPLDQTLQRGYHRRMTINSQLWFTYKAGPVIYQWDWPSISTGSLRQSNQGRFLQQKQRGWLRYPKSSSFMTPTSLLLGAWKTSLKTLLERTHWQTRSLALLKTSKGTISLSRIYPVPSHQIYLPKIFIVCISSCLKNIH